MAVFAINTTLCSLFIFVRRFFCASIVWTVTNVWFLSTFMLLLGYYSIFYLLCMYWQLCMYWRACAAELYPWLTASPQGCNQAWTADCGRRWRPLPKRHKLLLQTPEKVPNLFKLKYLLSKCYSAQVKVGSMWPFWGGLSGNSQWSCRRDVASHKEIHISGSWRTK